MKGQKIVFAPSDKVGEDSLHLIEKLFGIKGAFLTNESTLFDFDPVDEIPGHKLIKLSEIPPDGKRSYSKEKPAHIEAEKYLVWYPKLTDEEWEEIYKRETETACTC